MDGKIDGRRRGKKVKRISFEDEAIAIVLRAEDDFRRPELEKRFRPEWSTTGTSE